MTDERPTDQPDLSLWITDAELLRRAGIGEKKGYPLLMALDGDRRSGFPPKCEQWLGRRYWPAVKAYWDKVGGLTMDAPQNRERRHG